LGKPKLALSIATLRLGADPANTDARLVLALAADLLGRPERLYEVLQNIPDRTDSVSPLGRLMLGELLRRHVGAQLAKLWLGATAAAGAGEPLPAGFEGFLTSSE